MTKLLILCAIILFSSCGVPPEDWHNVKPTLPSTHAGTFTIDNKLYSQHCDPHGNQIWKKWDENIQQWKKVKYNTLGCKDGEHAQGPDRG